MNQPRILLLAFIVLNASVSHALDAFKCVRDLLPITEQSVNRIHRHDTEAPFMLGERYMVFREKRDGKVAGFYVFSEKDAVYYDAIEASGSGSKVLLTELTGDAGAYDLVAQMKSLETISLPYAGRQPTGVTAGEKKIAHLSTVNVKSQTELWRPLMSEVESRRLWIQNNNLPEDAFRRLTRIMETSCKP